jgi:hypothetical protein
MMAALSVTAAEKKILLSFAEELRELSYEGLSTRHFPATRGSPS